MEPTNDTVKMFEYMLSVAGAAITILLGIIVYYQRSQLTEQKEANKLNSKEHIEIKERLIVGSMKFQQVDRLTDDVDVLDKRVDGHDNEIIKINGKVSNLEKKAG